MWFPYLEAADVPEGVTAELGDVDQAIRDASYMVRDELQTARFEVHQSGPTAGQPVSTAVKETIRDATRAQLRFWAETGDSTGAGVQLGGGSILSVSLPGGAGTTSPSAKQDARVAPAVAQILRGCEDISWAVQY